MTRLALAVVAVVSIGGTLLFGYLSSDQFFDRFAAPEKKAERSYLRGMRVAKVCAPPSEMFVHRGPDGRLFLSSRYKLPYTPQAWSYLEGVAPGVTLEAVC